MIILCAGDALTAASTLREAGVPDGEAEALAARLGDAEAALAPERRAMFSRFEGLVMIDPNAGHPPAHHGPAQKN
jgi:hypothetical protein